MTLIPQLTEELKKLGCEDILVFAGGVIPMQNYDFLYQAGVVAIFGSGTSVAKAACQGRVPIGYSPWKTCLSRLSQHPQEMDDAIG